MNRVAVTGSRTALALILAGTVAAHAAADDDAVGSWLERPSLRSATGRFVVAAHEAADRITLARWADDVYRRFSEQWATPSSLPTDSVWGLVVEPAHQALPGGIARQRRIDGGQVVQSLRIGNLEQMDAEYFVESICALILNAMLLAAQTEAERMVFDDAVPEWLTVGVAQNLYPYHRSRNPAMVLNLWHGGVLPDAGTIMRWRHLPSHRVFEKPVCGVWVAWAAQAWPQRAAALQHWVALLADGQPLTPERISGPVGDPRTDLAADWEPHVASLQRLFSAADETGAAARYARLREVLRVEAGAGGIPARLALPADAGIEVLLEWRRAPWFDSVVRSRQREVAALALSGDPAYQALARQAAACLDGMAGRRPAFLMRRDFRGFADALAREETLALAREQYLTLYEQRHAPVFPGRDAAGADAPGPSALRRYLDVFDSP